MQVQKFGGTSVGSADAIRKVSQIVRNASEREPTLVVVSALGGVTDALQQLIEHAVRGVTPSEAFANVRQRHLDCVAELWPHEKGGQTSDFINGLFEELESLLAAVRTLGECSASSRARIMGFGERISSRIVHRYLSAQGLNNELLDPTELIVASGDPLAARVSMQETVERIRARFAASNATVLVSPGFIAGGTDGRVVTLGRGGSDYSASIFASAIDASRLEIWTDVSGVLTAEPKLVPDAYPISELSYEELLELSHFGAKVIHPPSVQPVLDKQIDLYVRNTFAPEAPGTRIHAAPSTEQAIRGVSSVPDVALITVLGSGMFGVPGTAERVFGALSRERLNVLFISQSSSEHSICLAVSAADAEHAKGSIEREFELEITLGRIRPPKVEVELTMIAVVGDGMRRNVGVAGRTFSLLGDNGINIRAIAQGSTERNISIVINTRDRPKALNVIHEGFFLSERKRVHLFCIGTGGVASSLLRQIAEQHASLQADQRLDIRIAGLCNTRKMLLDPDGIDAAQWNERLEEDGEPADLGAFISRLTELNLRNSCVVDNTASASVAAHYETLFNASVSVIASNKIAASSAYADYTQLRKTALKHGAHWMFETNVAAGLPVLRTIEDLLRSGDRIDRVEAVVSGTLNYISNELAADRPLSQVVTAAQSLGLTEPDPVIDLSGLDVIRKITIIARLCGTPMETQDVQAEAFLPTNLVSALSPTELQTKLTELDPTIETQRQQAAANNQRLRLTAQFANGKAKVGLQSVGPEHPAYELQGMDNIVLIYSSRYKEQPLVIKGAGAGRDVTAAGVFADILRYAHV